MREPPSGPGRRFGYPWIGRRKPKIARLGELGHRAASLPIRLSLSTSYWPLVWPPPRPVLLSVHLV
jgi:hypothetical protein